MNCKILLLALLLNQSTVGLQDSPQKKAEKNVKTFIKRKMSKKAAYTPIFFSPLDSGDSSILEIAPHFLTHKFQSRTPKGEVVIEEWLFFMDASLHIIAYADHSKDLRASRSDFGKYYDKVGVVADSVVNNIIKEPFK